jgi:glutamate formiminotransferase
MFIKERTGATDAVPAVPVSNRRRRSTLPRCYPCFNREIAQRMGLDYDAPQFRPVVLDDAAKTIASRSERDDERIVSYDPTLAGCQALPRSRTRLCGG